VRSVRQGDAAGLRRAGQAARFPTRAALGYGFGNAKAGAGFFRRETLMRRVKAA